MHYILPLLLVALIALIMAVIAFRHRSAPGSVPFLLLMLAVVIWSFGYAMELGSSTLPGKIFWTRVEYLGIILVPGAWLAFALQYTGYERWLARRHIALLAVEPLAMLAIIWTNDLHGLFWRSITLAPGDPLLAWRSTPGPAYWAHAAYTYLLLLAGTALLFRALIRTPGLYRHQAGALVFGALVPWFSNGIYLSGLSPFPHLELTPFAFAVTGLSLSWALFRFRLLDVVPIARDKVIESMSDGVVVLDAKNRVVDMNPAACRIVGRQRAAVIGQPAAAMFAPYLDVSAGSCATAETSREIVIAQGSAPRHFDLRISPLHDKAGAVTGRLIVLRDITEQKQAERALQEAKDAAETASRVKSAFLSTMSHELRTPLTAILGYNDLMRMEAQRHGYQTIISDLARVDAASQHLLALINDVLDLSQIEAGKSELQLDSCNVASLVNEMVETIRPLAARNRNQIEVRLLASPETITTDITRLRRILLNVLGNAAKFTEDGTITLEVTMDNGGPTADDVPPSILFTVHDTGIGISSEHMRNLFQPFTQGDSSDTRRYGGSGLGLALSKRLCDLLGGNIAATSEIGRGSTFTIRIPAAPK